MAFFAGIVLRAHVTEMSRTPWPTQADRLSMPGNNAELLLLRGHMRPISGRKNSCYFTWTFCGEIGGRTKG
jgi:hypothetical protein